MSRTVRRAGVKTVGLLITVALGAGLLAAAATLPVVGVAGIVARDAAKTFNGLPVPDLGQLPSRSTILDRNGHVIAYYYPNNIYRVPVTYTQIAPVMQHAIVAIEDARFYEHGALDTRGTFRALFTTASGGGTQGGSDLAQQYVKNALVLTASTRAERLAAVAVDLSRKIRELRIAATVEHEVNKNQLLADYLNAAYFDNKVIGIQVAARFYFSTTAANLTLPEAAMLAGMVEYPSLYNPLIHRSNAIERRNTVIAKMQQYGYVTAAQARSAEQAGLGLKVSNIPLQTGCTSPAAAKAAFFCDYVINVLRSDPAYKAVWSQLTTIGGLKIHTTLDAGDQRAADNAVNFIVPSNSNYYNPGHNVDTEVLLQPGTGDVRAIAVDRPFGLDKAAGQTTVDYAVNTKYGGSFGVQTGSSSKLFTLLTALKQGLPFGFNLKVTSPTTVGPYSNCKHQFVPPFAVINAEGPQKPATYTLYNGTTASINAFYATLEKQVGLCNVVRTAASLGVTRADGTSLLSRDPHLPASDNLSADNYPSFTLGSIYVSPMSMAAAYATVAARGIYCKPIAITAITGPGDQQLPVESAHCHHALSAGVADAANFVLQGVITSGTAAGREIGIPAAAKTGTANAGYYAAFAGYTPRMVGYVSVFNPIDPTTGGRMIGTNAYYREVGGYLDPINQMYGDNAPGATWQMTFLHLHLPAVSFVYPPFDPYLTEGNGFDSPGPPKKPKGPGGGGGHGGGGGGGGGPGGGGH